MFVAGYLLIGGRLIYLGLSEPLLGSQNLPPPSAARPDIVDRNGIVLAMDLPVSSVYAEPRRLLDVDEEVEKLTSVLPDLTASALHRSLRSDNGFAWIKRSISASERDAILEIGYFQRRLP